jgi:hypothetical protein
MLTVAKWIGGILLALIALVVLGAMAVSQEEQIQACHRKGGTWLGEECIDVREIQ